MIDTLYGWLDGIYSLQETPLRLLHFTTVRMVLAFITAFVITIKISPRLIAALYRRGIRDRVRDYSGEYARSKTGTPTMGGIIIVTALIGSALLWCNPHSRPVPLLFMTTLFFAGIGAWDDLLKLKNASSDKGLSRNAKILMQVLFGALFAVLMLNGSTSPFSEPLRTTLFVPLLPAEVTPPDLGPFYFLVILLAFLGISNAVNFADGLDGLAIVPACFVAVVFGIFAYFFSLAELRELVSFPKVPDLNEVTVFSAAYLGAGLGFLWFNSYPAQVFMGDTGSMSLGGTLAAMAVLTKTELLFLLVGGVFVFEFLSVTIQDYVGIKRIGRRLLLRAPSHHAFQHRGISETKVVLRFWIASFLLALLGLATLKIR